MKVMASTALSAVLSAGDREDAAPSVDVPGLAVVGGPMMICAAAWSCGACARICEHVYHTRGAGYCLCVSIFRGAGAVMLRRAAGMLGRGALVTLTSLREIHAGKWVMHLEYFGTTRKMHFNSS